MNTWELLVIAFVLLVIFARVLVMFGKVSGTCPNCGRRCWRGATSCKRCGQHFSGVVVDPGVADPANDKDTPPEDALSTPEAD